MDRLHDIRADRVAVAEAGIERQSIFAVDVHEVLAHLRLDRPLAEEGDLVEPAPPAGERVSHDGAAALPGAQSAAGLPLEPDRVGTTVTLDGGAVVGPERSGDRRPDGVVVVADQEPAHPLETLDQLGGQAAKHRRRVGHRGSAPGRWRNQAGKQHEAGELERVAELVVHAHGLVGRPLRRGVHALRVASPRRERLPLGHQTAKLPKDRLGLGRVAQPETANEERTVLDEEGAQRVAVLRRPARRAAGCLDLEYRRLPRLRVRLEL